MPCPSGPQSPEWAQMKAAIKGINDDGGAVIGEGAKIELLKAEGSAGVSPSKDLVERLDRALSAMFRGGDLSTMSSTSGHGTGSNQQTGESLLIEAADRQFVSEIMQAIERKVLDYYDGEEAEALVYGQIKGPSLNDAAQELRVDEFAVKYGVRLSIKDWAERNNRALADEDEPVLETQPQAAHSAGAGEHGEGGDDDDGQAVNFDPDQARDSDGKWTEGAGVGRKGPKIKVTRGDTLGDPDKADHTLENPILGGPDKDVKPEHAVYIVPMKDGKPDYSKMQAELQLLSATGEGADEIRKPLGPNDEVRKWQDRNSLLPPGFDINDVKTHEQAQTEAAEGLPKSKLPYWSGLKGKDDKMTRALQGMPEDRANKLVQLSPADIVSIGQRMGSTPEDIANDLREYRKGLMVHIARNAGQPALEEVFPQIQKDIMDAMDTLPKPPPETKEQRIARYRQHDATGLKPDEVPPMIARRAQPPISRTQYSGNVDDYSLYGPPGLAEKAANFNPQSRKDLTEVENLMRGAGFSDEVMDKYIVDLTRQAYEHPVEGPTTSVDQAKYWIQKAAQGLNTKNRLLGGKSYDNVDDDNVDNTDLKVTAPHLFYQFAMGIGPTTREYNEHSVLGKDMLTTDYLVAAMNKAADNARKGIFTKVPAVRSLGEDTDLEQMEYPFDFIYDNGMNPARAFQGSIAGEVTPGKPFERDGHTFIPLDITMSDENTAASGTRLPPKLGGYNGKEVPQKPDTRTVAPPASAKSPEEKQKWTKMPLKELWKQPAEELAKFTDSELRRLAMQAMQPPPPKVEPVNALVPYVNPYGPKGPLRTLHSRYKMHQEIRLDAPPLEHTKTFKEQLERIPGMADLHKYARAKKDAQKMADKLKEGLEQADRVKKSQESKDKEQKARDQEEIRKPLPLYDPIP